MRKLTFIFHKVNINQLKKENLNKRRKKNKTKFKQKKIKIRILKDFACVFEEKKNCNKNKVVFLCGDFGTKRERERRGNNIKDKRGRGKIDENETEDI